MSKFVLSNVELANVHKHLHSNIFLAFYNTNITQYVHQYLQNVTPIFFYENIINDEALFIFH